MSLSDFQGERRSVNMFTPLGTKLRGKRVFDAAMSTGTPHQLTSATATFAAGDVGKLVYVRGAGPSGADLVTTISSFTNATTVQLTGSASSTVSAAELRYGLDCQSALNSGNIYLSSTKKNGGILFIPRGTYLTSATVNINGNVRIEGEGYTSVSVFGGTTQEPQSFIMCVNPVPVFTLIGSPCYAASFSKLGMSGVPTSGSIGIFGAAAWDTTVEHCFFDVFGDQAILIQSTAPYFSVTGTFRHNFAQNCMMVRTGRTAFVGVVDLSCTDAFVKENNFTASFAESAGQIVTGFIASLAIRGANSFVHDNQLGHSELGCYVDPAASYSTFVNTRCDLNQGHGWVIASSKVGFMACRAHANSLDANHGWDGFYVTGAGNQFIGCRSTYNGSGSGVLFNQVLHSFETTNANTTEINQFEFCYVDPGSNTGGDFVQSGSQTNNTWIDATGNDPLVGGTIRTQSNFSIMDSNSLFQIQTTGPTDEKIWRQRMNYGSGFSEVLFSLLKDDLSVENTWLKCKRTGASPTLATIFPLLSLLAGLQVAGNISITSGHIEFDPSVTGIYVNNGTPNSVVTANGGSLCLDYGTSTLWVKASGSGNTGWVTVSTLTLPLAVTQGGSGQISLGADGVVLGNGTGSVNVTSAGTNRQFLAGVSGFQPIFRTLSTADGPGPSGTAVLAKITSGGSNGSLSFTNGFVTNYTAPT